MSEAPQIEIAKRLPGLMTDANLFVHSFDFENQTALVIKVPEDFYKEAVFLDNRALKDIAVGAHVPIPVLLEILKKTGAKINPCHFIFHIGHCGSTLVSRAFDTVPNVLGLREPMVLKTLAAAKNQGMPLGDLKKKLTVAYHFLGRQFTAKQTTLIKATSIANAIAPDLLAIHSDNKAVCLYIPLENFLANMAMKEEPKDIFNFFEHRKASLIAADPGLEIAVKEGELGKMMAVNWLGEVMELFRLYNGPFNSRCQFLNFEDILEDREGKFSDIAGHFGLFAPGSTDLDDIFGDYSKLPGFKYGPEDRRLNLEESKIENKTIIDQGMRYVQGLADQSTIIAKALKVFPLYA